jgi:beta-glucosidase
MDRIDTLVAAMTLEEKLGQLNMTAAHRVTTGPGARKPVEDGVRSGRIGSLLNIWGAHEVHALQRLAVEGSRLGVPLIFGLDVIHGHRTIFPVPLAEACVFDADSWERSARVAAAEAAQDGIALTFAPMIDVTREPRWGRMVESPGEDPWVGAAFAAAKTRGFQGGDLGAATALAATAKHLCAYGAVTAGREYAPVDVAERTVHELFLPPFAAAVAARVAAVMPALTDLAGVPMTANATLLQGWLRERLSFDGVVISDYHAVAELCAHGVARDAAEAAALALQAGVDIDMAGDTYVSGLPAALERGLVTIAQVDTSVRRVLALKEQLGLFDDPYRRGASRGAIAGARALAREVARRAVVLLSHPRPVLPLPPEVRHIALVGPLAAARGDMLGPWASAGRSDEAVSIADGLRAALPHCRIDCASGVELEGADRGGIAAALGLARAAELTILCVGEGAAMSGEAASRADLGLPGRQRLLAEALLDVGRPLVALLCAGRPLVVPWLFERAHAVLATWFLGSEAGHAIADVLTGSHNPSGKLPVTWPRHEGQIPTFYAQRPSGRPARPGERFSSGYRDVPVAPQFPFGHGLSYGRFTLADLRCASPVRVGECLVVSVSIRNDATAAGDATVFLFVRDRYASIARPALELKGVRRVRLGPGESAHLAWRLATDVLTFIGAGLEAVLEPGTFEVHVGQSADPAGLIGTTFELLP